MAARTGDSERKNATNSDVPARAHRSGHPDTDERCYSLQRETRQKAYTERFQAEADPETGLCAPMGGHSRDPVKRAIQFAARRPPWSAGDRPPGGRRKGPTLAEDARAILDGGVPAIVRDRVVKVTGKPLHEVRKLSLRQAVVLMLLTDYLAKGKLDALAAIIDRTDPKSRRVEHAGAVGHLHAIAAGTVPLTEADAAEIYRGLLPGGTIDLGPDAVSVEPGD